MNDGVHDHVRKLILLLRARGGNTVMKPIDPAPPQGAIITQTIEEEDGRLFGPVSLVQGSDAWRLARCGSLGASEVADAIARTKTGWGASRANAMAALIVERLTGVPQDSFVSTAMKHGTDTEPQARAEYEFMRDVEIVQVGLIRHPFIAGTHASPDGLIGDDGLVEIKCPQSATHLETLLGGSIPGKYVCQAQWQMACTGRQWVDIVSYDPRMPPEMRLNIQRIQRDEARIKELSKLVEDFLAEAAQKEAELRRRYTLEIVPSPVHEALRASVAAL